MRSYPILTYPAPKLARPRNLQPTQRYLSPLAFFTVASRVAIELQLSVVTHAASDGVMMESLGASDGVAGDSLWRCPGCVDFLSDAEFFTPEWDEHQPYVRLHYYPPSLKDDIQCFAQTPPTASSILPLRT